jgi:tetratricopeptide (TPR) repeat protein
MLGVLLCLDGRLSATAQDLGSDAQWGLAQHLFQSGEYYRAITEYKRFAFYFPDDERAPMARLKVVESYVRGEWWEEGIQTAQDLLRETASKELRARTLYFQGVCQLRLARFDEARRAFREVLQVSEDPDLRDRAQYLLGEMSALEEDWEDAAEILNHIEPQSQLYDQAHQGALSIDEHTPLEEKSPLAAGVLAGLLPGAGHLYLGRARDAGLAFSVNAAFTVATIEAVHKDNEALAGGLAAMELLWYAGNIFSAVSSTHKYNRRLRRQLLDEVLLPPAWVMDLPPLGSGAME